MADDVAVMYAGRIVEQGTAVEVYKRPQHPYTAALLAARPRLDDPGRRLVSIKGAPPDLAELPGECAFLPRCVKAVNVCRTDPWPELRELRARARRCLLQPHVPPGRLAGYGATLCASALRSKTAEFVQQQLERRLVILQPALHAEVRLDQEPVRPAQVLP